MTPVYPPVKIVEAELLSKLDVDFIRRVKIDKFYVLIYVLPKPVSYPDETDLDIIKRHWPKAYGWSKLADLKVATELLNIAHQMRKYRPGAFRITILHHERR